MILQILDIYKFGGGILAAKVFAHQLWNVKRGIFNLPVSHNLILNLSSLGGLGKTNLMKKFSDPISFFCNTEIKLDTLLDDFSYDALCKTLSIMSELGVRARKDRNVDDDVKCLVDCSITQRRQIHTDTILSVTPRVVIIGTANNHIQECLPNLSDGNRRYFNIESVANAEDIRGIHEEADRQLWKNANFDIYEIYRLLDVDVDPLSAEDWASVQKIQRTYICDESFRAWLLEEENPTEDMYSEYRDFCYEKHYSKVPFSQFRNLISAKTGRRKNV